MSIARHRPHGTGWLPPWSALRGRLRRRAALATGLALAVTPLAACGSDAIMGEAGGGSSGNEVTLNWYIIPDPTTETDVGQNGIAARCSDDSDEYNN